MTEQEKCNLQRFRHYITMILNPRHVLSYMGAWLEQSTVEWIKAEEQRGISAAAVKFLDCLLSLELDGWFRGFLDGLNAAGYTGLSEAIENWDFCKIESLDDYRRILRIIEPTVKTEIKPEDLVIHLKDCVILGDIEEISQGLCSKSSTGSAGRGCLCTDFKQQKTL